MVWVQSRGLDQIGIFCLLFFPLSWHNMSERLVASKTLPLFLSVSTFPLNISTGKTEPRSVHVTQIKSWKQKKITQNWSFCTIIFSKYFFRYVSINKKRFSNLRPGPYHFFIIEYQAYTDMKYISNDDSLWKTVY